MGYEKSKLEDDHLDDNDDFWYDTLSDEWVNIYIDLIEEIKTKSKMYPKPFDRLFKEKMMSWLIDDLKKVSE